ncbi:MAG: A/G-specific adenine glycosylase [Bacteroidetes bacterium GWF2_33_16]|nr:MAG: A/G-specific adenine glycosylase [Bacteroidetes bacterium GWE2_32_14]OFY08864.1 MAG: A/G-specific adenine glycosylase [Bacteroidetes bacterium GWF2_33_16]
MILSNILINWYNQNKRDLPWREINDPYIIWVSEIILQQTRVNQGINYYYRFIEQYPDIKSLANAPIDDVLKLWQGLGYYSRARNMHHTAKTIIHEYNGKFPNHYSEIIKLKGIGEYTAAAIASFCFNESVPVIDGNVYRFLSRFFGIKELTATASGKQIFKNLAEEIIDPTMPGIHNQAIMEFGALICTPQNPNCMQCPLNKQCIALNNDLVDELPLKKKKIKITKRYFHYIHIIYKENVFIEQRIKNDIWQLLYQMPLIETKNKISTEEVIKHPLWTKLFENTNAKIIHISNNIKHQLSHQQINAHFYKVQIDKINPFLKSDFIMVTNSEISKYGIPRLIDKYLNNPFH